MLTPQQICLRVDANVGAKEDGAHTEGHFEVKMFRPVESESKKSPPPCIDTAGQELPLEKKDSSKGCSLYWNLPIPIPVLDKVVRQYITISLFDEMAYIKGVGETGSLPFLKVESNTRNKFLILAPDVNWVVH